MKLTIDKSPNYDTGAFTPKVIVIHQWGDPATKPSLEGVLAHLTDPAPGGDANKAVSAHYVVSGDKVIRLVGENFRAWHAMQANPFALGIEVDPRAPGNTYQTVGELIRSVRSRWGPLPIKKHSDYVNTRCPCFLDFARIVKEANKKEENKDVTTTQSSLNKNFRLFMGQAPDQRAVKANVGVRSDDDAEQAIKSTKAYELERMALKEADKILSKLTGEDAAAYKVVRRHLSQAMLK